MCRKYKHIQSICRAFSLILGRSLVRRKTRYFSLDNEREDVKTLRGFYRENQFALEHRYLSRSNLGRSYSRGVDGCCFYNCRGCGRHRGDLFHSPLSGEIPHRSFGEIRTYFLFSFCSKLTIFPANFRSWSVSEKLQPRSI